MLVSNMMLVNGDCPRQVSACPVKEAASSPRVAGAIKSRPSSSLLLVSSLQAAEEVGGGGRTEAALVERMPLIFSQTRAGSACLQPPVKLLHVHG